MFRATANRFRKIAPDGRTPGFRSISSDDSGSVVILKRKIVNYVCDYSNFLKTYFSRVRYFVYNKL